MQYVAKEGQSIYDLALLLYGDASFSVKIIYDNPTLNLDNLDIKGFSVNYDATVKAPFKAPFVLSKIILPDTKPSYIVKQNQSIYDLAIMYGYGIGSVVRFIQDSPQLLNLDNTSIQNNEIIVTKIKDSLSKYLFLQGKTLATNTLFITPVVVVVGDWILATGFWDDSGVWDDTAIWID